MTIEASVRKSNNVLIVEQGTIGTSYGSWLADEIQRRLFDWLDSPLVARVHGCTGGETSRLVDFTEGLLRALYPGAPRRQRP